ncbi:MAG: hypothetical protein JW807_14545 [Spirochaetes bacterium]|nr:hypothetical protein [Spirochaetota bacterium]
MKQFFTKTIVIAVVVGAAYLLFFSLVKVDTGRLRVIEDLRSHKVLRIVKPCAGTWAFAWERAFPWRYIIAEMSELRAAHFKINVSIPELSNLKEDYYAVRVPVRVSYRIDRDSFGDASKLSDGGRRADDLVKKFFDDELQRDLNNYLFPYQPEVLKAQVENILEGAVKKLEPELKRFGLLLESARITGGVIMPDRLIYNEGVMHAADLRKADRVVQKGLMEARSAMENEKIRNEQLYSKLREISEIISENPDILKYIYIDKMAGNVKVILSSDGEGVPRMLEKEVESGTGKTKEIDNLR